MKNRYSDKLQKLLMVLCQFLIYRRNEQQSQNEHIIINGLEVYNNDFFLIAFRK